MRTVLWVTHVYPRHADDMLGAFLHRLARELPRRGLRTIVLAPAADGVPETERRDDVEIRRFRYAEPGRQTLAYTGEMHRAALRQPMEAVRFFSALRRSTAALLAELQPDVVHAHWWVPTAWAVSKPVWEQHIPLVISMHGTDVRLLQRVPGATPVARRVFARAALTLPVSGALAKSLADRGLSGGRQEVLPMPADGDVFRPSDVPRGASFVVAARLTRQKRVDIAIRALAILRAQGHAAELEIAGDGPERPSLEALSRSLDVAEATRFLGVVSPRDLASSFQAASAVVLASDQEGYGLALVEGALCGTPPVGAASGGIADVIQGEETGLLFRPGDAPGLATALRRLLQDPALVTRLGRTARERALARTAGPIADRLLTLYDSTRTR